MCCRCLAGMKPSLEQLLASARMHAPIHELQRIDSQAKHFQGLLQALQQGQVHPSTARENVAGAPQQGTAQAPAAAAWLGFCLLHEYCMSSLTAAGSSREGRASSREAKEGGRRPMVLAGSPWRAGSATASPKPSSAGTVGGTVSGTLELPPLKSPLSSGGGSGRLPSPELRGL